MGELRKAMIHMIRMTGIGAVVILGALTQAHAQTYPERGAPLSSAYAVQAGSPSNFDAPLYYWKEEDITAARYWNTPQELGGARRTGQSSWQSGPAR